MSMQRLAEELAGLKDEMAPMATENATAALSASREKIDEAAKLFSIFCSRE
jgi:acyl-CoA reductase-like NAD-dependent aldehyde dehydrogenase